MSVLCDDVGFVIGLFGDSRHPERAVARTVRKLSDHGGFVGYGWSRAVYP